MKVYLASFVQERRNNHDNEKKSSFSFYLVFLAFGFCERVCGLVKTEFR